MGLRRRHSGEIGRLRELVADQHRRLRLVQGELAGLAPATLVEESFPARCAKPRLTRAALARLIAETERRLALADSLLGAALRAAWPEERPEVPRLRPAPGLAAYALADRDDLPNLVVTLFGLEREERERAVARVLAEQAGGDPFLPVFLTNDPDFTPFRDQRLAFEYFPFVCDEAAGPPARLWAAYFVATLELTLRRWGVRRVLAA